MKTRLGYRHTLRASYIGYITQAAVNNFSPLLFVMFNSVFGLSMLKISSLITVNFGIQLLIDLLSAFFIDRLGYKRSAVIAHFSAFTGMTLLGILPVIMADKYAALLIPTVFNAVGGGLCEVIVSPIVEACPTDNKSGNMSLLHSFYCWGQLGVVLFSTLFFKVFGEEKWYILSILIGLIPLFNAFYFMAVPVNTLTPGGAGLKIRNLLGIKAVYVFLLMMVCAGASEIAMSQWASAFAESGLHVNKAIGDLIGPAMFAAFMGVSRVLYAVMSEKLNLGRFILISSLLCLACYITVAFSSSPALSLAACAVTGFSVGIMWPGVYSLAAGIIKNGGIVMFSLLALAGDFGCISGPSLVGIISSSHGNDFRLGFLFSAIFPLALITGVILLRKVTSNERQVKECIQGN